MQVGDLVQCKQSVGGYHGPTMLVMHFMLDGKHVQLLRYGKLIVGVIKKLEVVSYASR